MSRRKVVKRKGEGSPRADETHGENDQLPPDAVAGDGEDPLKLMWRDLMSDIGGLILTTFDTDPHRFDEQKVEDRKGSFGLAIIALIGGTAVLLALLQLLGG